MKTVVQNQRMSVVGRQYLDGGVTDGGTSKIGGHDWWSRDYGPGGIFGRGGGKTIAIFVIIVGLIVAFLLWYFGFF
jgi:hypothetical protein